jgi:hypothetical protein
MMIGARWTIVLDHVWNLTTKQLGPYYPDTPMSEPWNII